MNRVASNRASETGRSQRLASKFEVPAQRTLQLRPTSIGHHPCLHAFPPTSIGHHPCLHAFPPTSIGHHPCLPAFANLPPGTRVSSLQVMRESTITPGAEISFGWEDRAFYADWMGDSDSDVVTRLQGPAFNVGGAIGKHADVLLDQPHLVRPRVRRTIDDTPPPATRRGLQALPHGSLARHAQ